MGGWNRIVLDFDDLQAVVAKLKADGVKFLDGVGGKQVIYEDPYGNVIELMTFSSLAR